MTLAKKFRDDLIGLTPLFAVVGATDLAAAKLRELGADRPRGTEVEGEPERRGVTHDVELLVRGARRVPGFAIEQAVNRVTLTQTAYEDLAGRGRRLAGRARAEGEQGAEAGQERAAEAVRTAGRRVDATRRRARTVFDRTREGVATTASTAAATGRREAGEVVDAVEHGSRPRRGRVGVTEPQAPHTPPRRRRTSAAARTAAPAPIRPAVVEPDPSGAPSPAGGGIESAAATPRLAGRPSTRRRLTRDVPEVASPAGDAAAATPVRRRRRATASASATPGEQPDLVSVTPDVGSVTPSNTPAPAATPAPAPTATVAATPTTTPAAAPASGLGAGGAGPSAVGAPTTTPRRRRRPTTTAAATTNAAVSEGAGDAGPARAVPTTPAAPSTSAVPTTTPAPSSAADGTPPATRPAPRRRTRPTPAAADRPIPSPTDSPLDPEA